MFVREVQKTNGSVSIRIVESIRQDGKVIQKTIRSLGQHKNPSEIELIKKTAKSLIASIQNTRDPLLTIFDPQDFYANKNRNKKKQGDFIPPENVPAVQIHNLQEKARFNDGIYDIFGPLYEQLGFDSILDKTRQDRKWNDTLQACVLSRIAQPSSKMKSSQILAESFNLKIDLDHIYRMMDHVAASEDKIKQVITQKTKILFKGKINLLLFDVTTLYFESTQRDELRDFGFSKDCKFNQTQVVLALITTTEGTPIGYELFPGNTSESKTLIEILKKMKSFYELEHLILVADRAMFNTQNLDYLESLGVRYVVAAKLRGLKKNLKEEILNSANFKITEVLGEVHWVNQFEISSSRGLMVSYSSLRARKDKVDRDRILSKLNKKTKDGKIKIQDLVSNQGSKKYVKMEKLNASLDPDKINKDEQWDGFHGIISNVKDQSAAQLLTRYRDLWKIEEAFRINKHDLKLRPIYHWKPKRIRAHIAICYIAFALLSYAQLQLKEKKLKLSFDLLREELLKAQSSLMQDTQSNTLFEIPSKATELQRKIYQAFKLTRTQSPKILQQ